MHANEYSEILICPTTRQKLRLATEREIEALRQREGLAKIESAWIRADRAVAYPVIRGIPLLVAANAISLRKSPKEKDTP
ncbi:MAG: hypothetical protein ACKOLA_05480 [Spartobacteria bacterium]